MEDRTTSEPTPLLHCQINGLISLIWLYIYYSQQLATYNIFFSLKNLPKKRMNTKQNAFFLLLTALLLIIFLSTQAAAGRCNASRISDCLAAEEEEFLMDSESSRRILLAGKSQTIPVLRKPSFCNRNVHASCIGKESKYYQSRPCTYGNQCHRKP